MNFVSDKKDVAGAILSVLIGFLFIEFVLTPQAGLSVFIFIFLFYIFVSVYLYNKRLPFNKSSIWLLIPIVLLSLTFVIFNDTTLNFINSLMLMVMIPLQLSLMTNMRMYDNFSGFFWLESLSTGFIMPIANVDKIFLFKRKKNPKLLMILLGVIIALPILIIVMLLLSSDMAFSNIVRKVTEFFSENIFDYMFKLVYGFILAIFLFGGLYRLRYKTSKDVCKVNVNKQNLRVVDTVLSSTVVWILNAVYVVYLISQLDYFINPKYTMPLSYYARRGFFELVLVVGINLLIVFFVYMYSKRNDEAITKGIKISLFVLTFLSILITASAAYKMIIYVSAYGFTRLRVITLALMLFFLIVIIGVIVKLFAKNININKLILTSGVLIILAISYLNVDGFISKYNVDNYLNGNLKTVDIMYLRRLNYAAVPNMVKLLDASDPDVRNEAKTQLQSKYYGYLNYDEKGWKSLNLTKELAKKAFEENGINGHSAG